MGAPHPRRHPVEVDGERAMIADAPELAIALELLRGSPGARELIDQLRPNLAAVIGGPDGLLLVARVLEAGDRAHLVEALGERFEGVVRSGRHLAELLALTPDQESEERMLLTLGPGALRSIAATPHLLAGLLQWIYGECDRLLLDLLGAEHLSRIVTSAAELAHLLHSLDPDGREHLLRLLGPECAARLVRSAHDLGRLLRSLPRPAAAALLGRITTAEIVALVGSEAEWHRLCRRLPDEEAALLFERLGYGRAS